MNDDRHFHKCAACGHVWGHTLYEAQEDPTSHQCRSCGYWEWFFYDTTKAEVALCVAPTERSIP